MYEWDHAPGQRCADDFAVVLSLVIKTFHLYMYPHIHWMPSSDPPSSQYVACGCSVIAISSQHLSCFIFQMSKSASSPIILYPVTNEKRNRNKADMSHVWCDGWLVYWSQQPALRTAASTPSDKSLYALWQVVNGIPVIMMTSLYRWTCVEHRLYTCILNASKHKKPIQLMLYTRRDNLTYSIRSARRLIDIIWILFILLLKRFFHTAIRDSTLNISAAAISRQLDSLFSVAAIRRK